MVGSLWCNSRSKTYSVICGGIGALGPKRPKKVTAIRGTESEGLAQTESRAAGANRKEGFCQKRTGSSDGPKEKPTRGKSGRRLSINLTARKKSNAYGRLINSSIKGCGEFPFESAIA